MSDQVSELVILLRQIIDTPLVSTDVEGHHARAFEVVLDKLAALGEGAGELEACRARVQQLEEVLQKTETDHLLVLDALRVEHSRALQEQELIKEDLEREVERLHNIVNIFCATYHQLAAEGERVERGRGEFTTTAANRRTKS